ncbi:hypothetical protein ACJMK2_043946, partial [Sinanodonta woodiana]
MELEEFTLKLMHENPVNLKPYPLPYVKLKTVRKEIRAMVDLGVIETTESAYRSYAVLVQKKSDGTHSFYVDNRKLNWITEFQ